jgi:hypothetical protein
MKRLTYILTVVIITMTSCTIEPLDQKMAMELLIKEYQYPQVLDYDIYCSDPEHAKMVLKSGLEEMGLVTVKRTQKLKDIGTPLIHFTANAKPYFLPTSEDDKKSNIQKVKIADEEFGAIMEIKILNSGDKAIVSYTTMRNKTIFGTLLRKATSTTKPYKAYFILTESGWQIVKKSDIDLLFL